MKTFSGYAAKSVAGASCSCINLELEAPATLKKDIQMEKSIKNLKRGIIVSCQAIPGNPLYNTNTMYLMAMAAEAGGAAGIRCNGPDDVKMIKKHCQVPVIGIYKTAPSENEAYITPTYEMAEEITRAGADIIALDSTPRPRPGKLSAKELIQKIRKDLKIPVMADISTYDEGLKSAEWGADIVATTLSGYTSYSKTNSREPDFDLIKKLRDKLDIPVICEGRIWTHENALKAFKFGAYAVVIGKAITNPMAITQKYVNAINPGSTSAYSGSYGERKK